LDEDEGLGSAQFLSVHPSGRFLYEQGRVAPRTTVIRSFTIDPVRGSLAKLEDASLGDRFSEEPPLDVLATDTALYATTGDSGSGLHTQFLRWPLNPDSGRLGPVEHAYDVGTQPFGSMAWAPPRAALYLYAEDLDRTPLIGLRAVHVT